MNNTIYFTIRLGPYSAKPEHLIILCFVFLNNTYYHISYYNHTESRPAEVIPACGNTCRHRCYQDKCRE